ARGAQVIIGDASQPDLDATIDTLRSQDHEVIGVCEDLTEESGAKQLIDTAMNAFARLDILVNNLGGSRNAKVWEMSLDDWDFVMRLNLRSLFLCTKHALPPMIDARYGKIVGLSSGAREGTPWTAYYQGGAAYSTTKAGVHGFIRDVALEVAEFGINVNAVAPGPIDTERVGAGLKRLNETVEYSPNRMTPLGRLGTPQEVADAVAFLVSEEASYITGHTLAVAGGR
ncbi:MAG: SDR family NAD(P)-dependent oxidoreductase, partial [Pseudomonadota bacterium]